MRSRCHPDAVIARSITTSPTTENAVAIGDVAGAQIREVEASIDGVAVALSAARLDEIAVVDERETAPAP
jgi:hypothetical protein